MGLSWMRVARTMAAVVALAVVGAAPASADIKAFNAAVKAGDYKTAAAEAKTSWASFDKASAEAAIVAREFGFASYVAGDYAAAREYGVFLRDKGPTLAQPDEQPIISAVLLAASEYRLDAKGGTRGRLFDALIRRMTLGGIDNLSVHASVALYKGDWSEGEWPRAGASARLSSELLRRGGQPFQTRELEARSIAAAAGFLGGKDHDDYHALADAHDAIIDAIDNAADDRKTRLELKPLKYEVEAWVLAVETYWQAVDQNGLFEKEVDKRKLKQPKIPLYQLVTENRAMPCRGALDDKGMRYPASATFKNLTGAVIVRVGFDAEGKLTESEILGAVPATSFAETVQKYAPGFRLKRVSTDPDDCSLEQKNRLLTFTFHIG